METAWNSQRRREDKSKHENAFLYFLVPLHLCPSKPQAAILMNAFKPQRELRRTIFDRSEEGTKYSSPVREMYSIISCLLFLPLSGQSLHFPMLLSCCLCCAVSFVVTWLEQNKDNIMRYNFVLFWKGSLNMRHLRLISKLILHIVPQYNFHLPNNTLEFLKCIHISKFI